MIIEARSYLSPVSPPTKSPFSQPTEVVHSRLCELRPHVHALQRPMLSILVFTPVKVHMLRYTGNEVFMHSLLSLINMSTSDQGKPEGILSEEGTLMLAQVRHIIYGGHE